MVDPDRQPLRGIVEADETIIPFRTKNDLIVVPAGPSPSVESHAKVYIGELGHTFEDTATNTLGGYFPEPMLYKIEPRRRCRNKMEVKARMPGKPGLDAWMLVGRIIIGDAVNIQLLRRCSVNSFQEFEDS